MQVAALEKDESKAAQLKLWKQLAELKRQTVTENAQTAGFQQRIKAVDEQIKAIKKQEAQNQTRFPNSSMDLAALEKGLAETKSSLATAQENLQQLTVNRQNAVKRTQDIPKEIGTLKGKLTALSPIAAPDASAAPDIKLPYYLYLANKQELEASIAALNSELKTIEAEEPLRNTRLSTTELSISRLQQALTKWTSARDAALTKQTQSQQSDAKALLERCRAVPQLKQLAEENIQLSDELLGENNVTEQIKTAKATLASTQADLDDLKTKATYAKERIRLLESSKLPIDRSTGQLLRTQRASLPSPSKLREQLRLELEAVTTNQLRLLELNNSLSKLPNSPTTFAAAILQEHGGSVSDRDVIDLLTRQTALYERLISARKTLELTQEKTVEALQETVTTSNDYSRYLDSRLLWIASAPPLSSNDFTLEAEGFSKVFSAEHLSSWRNTLVTDMQSHKFLWALVALVVILLLARRNRYKILAQHRYEQAQRSYCTTIAPTFISLLLEFLLIAPFSLAILFITWRSGQSSLYSPGLYSAAGFGTVAGMVWLLSRRDGFLVSNFNLEEPKRKLTHRVMTWFIPALFPVIIMLGCLLHLDGVEPYGRISLMIALTILAVAMHQLFRPEKQLIPSGNLIRFAAYLFGVICPIVLVIGAATGYFSSVLTLRVQLVASIWLVVIIAFIAALLTRWLLVSRRHVAVKQSLLRREAALAKAKEEGGESTAETPIEELKHAAAKSTQVKEQTQRLIKVAALCSIAFGLLGIWSTSLPALSVLDNVTLWHTSTEASVSNPTSSLIPTGSNSAETPVATAATTTISLLEVLVTLVIFFLTYVAAKNVPGLLEITILNRINLGTGASFAFTTAVRYLIVLIGIIWAFGNIGITWSKVQWIAAAVTLGIGFGLQEVFANFVAGLILLFERPIRIGDMVSIGDINGRVSKIKIRATTILQFNNRELIVPNKEFITGQLINWTLSDNVMRTEIPVGIAYGSDTEQAKQLLLQCAKENSRVLDTPESDVIFQAFGASSLDFQLRVYVAGSDHLIPVQSELHFAVDKAFREADIEIAFPQQDIHIRSVDSAIPLKLDAKEE